MTNATSTFAASTCCTFCSPAARLEMAVRRGSTRTMRSPSRSTRSPTTGSQPRGRARRDTPSTSTRYSAPKSAMTRVGNAKPPVNIGWACRSRPAGGASRGKLRRRPTAGQRSDQAQPSRRHLLLRISSGRLPLPAFELGLPLLGEGLDSLVGVLRDKHAADGLALDGQTDVEGRSEALLNRELGVAQGDARPFGELRRVVDRALTARRGVGEQAVDDAGLQSIRGLQGRRADDHVEALRQADQARQSLRPSRAWEETEICLGKTDLI